MEGIKTRYKSVLTIAGSDSGGCAGIQADIKSISACGAYAASVITASTAQNTQGVIDIHALPIAHIEKQLDAVLSDIHFDAVKIGMLHSCEVIQAVKAKLVHYKVKNIVIDPVMIASSGDRLISKDAVACLKYFLPMAALITPNIPEAELLSGYAINLSNMEPIARKVGQLFQTSILLKGGHLDPNTEQLVDVFYNHSLDKLVTIKKTRVNTHNTHGTGCSLSSSIAAFLSKEDELEEAVKKGCAYVRKAIITGEHKVLGKGNGPINHFGLR